MLTNAYVPPVLGKLVKYTFTSIMKKERKRKGKERRGRKRKDEEGGKNRKKT